MAYNYFDQLDNSAKARYKVKLDLINCDDCPYKFPAAVWENDPCKWPPLQYGDLYSYLIDSPGIFTRVTMKAYKSLEAYNYFQSGWVHTVMNYMPPNSAYMLLRADVMPSQRVNDEPHHPWVALAVDGTVAVAHCDCMAGLSESCSHIAAMLFKIEGAVRLGYTSLACTELPCKWNSDFVKKVQPAEIKDISFYKGTSVARVRNRMATNHKLNSRVYEKSTVQEQENFLGTLLACKTKPVVLSTFEKFSEKFHWQKNTNPEPKLPQCLRSLYNQDNCTLTKGDLLEKCADQVNSLQVSAEVISYIHDLTIRQSSSLTWHEQRIGRITSSKVHDILHTNLDNPSPSLLQSLCSQSMKSLDHIPAVRWGKENEAIALEEYAATMATIHKDFKIQPTGLLICDKLPFLAASADSLASCSCHGRRVVEVKCPFSHKESTLEEYIKDPTSCLTEDGRALKDNHKYYSQVQLQLFVHNVETCDLVVYTLKMTAILHISRDNEFISSMTDRVKVFYLNCVMPELLTRRLEQSAVTLHNSVTDQRFYCLCHSKDDGKADMIGCDNPKCKLQWFHLKCIKMKRVPKGQWFCKECKKNSLTLNVCSFSEYTA